jgi:hypothetical protein
MKSARAEDLKAAITQPALEKGEIYVGAIIGPDGKGNHVVLIAGDTELTWSKAMAWAKKQGGDLPTRIEQALLFAHHKDKFEQRAYWSNTPLADDAGYAWFQDFYDGLQSDWRQSGTLRARAVRRVPI